MPIDSQAIKQAKTAGEAAAMWWASVLGNPKLDNGDDNPMTGLLASLTKVTLPKQPTDGLEQFKTILAERLTQQFTDNDPDGYTASYGITLRVDYHPDRLLSECAQQAGLRSGMTDWPWKTTMWVKADEVSVSYGYGAEAQIIWAKLS